MMTSAQVVETSVKLITNSASQDYTHPDNHNLSTYDNDDGDSLKKYNYWYVIIKVTVNRKNILLKLHVDLSNFSKYWIHCLVNHLFLCQHFEVKYYVAEHSLS